ncbi:MAG: MSHA biogenesis protein MshO [Paraglaciecola sp.]|jgi:MSHA biogenesis protein MshO
MHGLNSHVAMNSNKGFTLIELITVIIILGIVSVGIAGFIRSGMGIYLDVTERDQVLSESRFVLERLNRELRMAVPNSARVVTNTPATTQCIEFVPISWVTYYTELPIQPSTATTANVVRISDDTGQFVINPGSDFALVYPTSNADIYDTPEPNEIKRQLITACTDDGASSDCATNDSSNNLNTLTLAGAFADGSPASRMYIVREAVSYCVRNQKIYRHTDTIKTVQTVYSSGGILMAENLINDLSDSEQRVFRVFQPTLNRNGLINLLFTFNKNDEIINFSHEVHIPNVP